MSASVILILCLSPLSAFAHGMIRQVGYNFRQERQWAPNLWNEGDPRNRDTPVLSMIRPDRGGFATPRDYRNARKMACGESRPAPKYISIPAGGTLNVYWEGSSSELKGYKGLNEYNPYVHAMGPIFDYIAQCKDNDCTKFEAGDAKWIKIGEETIDLNADVDPELKRLMAAKFTGSEPYKPAQGKGLWALAKMIQKNSTWDIKIPNTLKAGKYLIRHDVAANQIPLDKNSGNNGPQHYIGCINVDVTGNGTVTLPDNGVTADKFHDPRGPLATFNVHADNFANFKPDSPPLWDWDGKDDKEDDKDDD